MIINLPNGKRFSHVYLERGEPTLDSVRMRRRLASLISRTPDLKDLGLKASDELGVVIPYVSSYTGTDAHHWRAFLETCELRDVLDLVTIAYCYLVEMRRGAMRDLHTPEKWVHEVARIFAEENVGYRVDQRGGVHFAVDSEFESNRASALAILGAPRYANARAEFETALAALPENGKAAIRGTFQAAEALFRLMFAQAPRLGSKEVEKYLPPTLQRVYADDRAALGSASKLVASVGEWVNACHFYRHEAGTEDVAQPPLTLAVNLVSVGATYIRWLAEVDAQQLQIKASVAQTVAQDGRETR